jgi:hypothetical protein
MNPTELLPFLSIITLPSITKGSPSLPPIKTEAVVVIKYVDIINN